MTTLAKEFNLSDNGLRKICKKNDIPLPNAGHWSKVQFGYKTTKIKLPNLDKPEPKRWNANNANSHK
jgi:hypothetical protein